MNFFMIVLFYLISSSVIFVYGIGLANLYVYIKKPQGIFIFLLKNFILQIAAVSFLWFLNKLVLEEFNISFLLPVFVSVILFLLNEILKFALPKIKFHTEEELVFYYGPVFLSVFIASSYLQAVAMIVAVNLGFLIFSFILNAIKLKTDEGNANNYWKQAPLFLISIGIILTGFYFIDIIV